MPASCSRRLEASRPDSKTALLTHKKWNPPTAVRPRPRPYRGIPELHGYDAAYGILALLKEIHAKLPESKILLMPIFPRGDTPEDEGRKRNDEINKIIHTYVDNETVHWLDLSHVFLNEQGNLRRELMPARLRPNEQGYRAWAEAMEPTLQKLLGENAEE